MSLQKSKTGEEDMMRSLWTAATGMTAQQFNIDTVANNLSNVNTTGYKKTRADFQELIYQTLRVPGTASSINTEHPTGIQSGLGVEIAASQKMFSQGTPKETKNPLDMAILGEGFFKIRTPDGQSAYTRNGAFQIDANGDLITSDGYYMDPPIRFDLDVIQESIKISESGKVSYKTSSMTPGEEAKEAGTITLYRFVNPKGLQSSGKNLFTVSAASGQEFEGDANSQGYGKILQSYIESSNVQMVEEMVNMIVAQRAYEFSSKAIQTSDAMLATAVNLKR